MDQEVDSKINEIKAIDIENNLLLKKLVKQGQIALWSKLAYWVIIILITIGAFAVVKPLLGTLGSVYAPSGVGESLKSLSAPGAFDELKAQLSE
jgi:hypothetical protein